MTGRLGYACINLSIQEDETIPKKSRSCVNRSCIAKTFREKGPEHAIGLARQNLQNVLKVLEWNEKEGIRLYRMSSDMFPHLTNPEFIQGNRNDDFSYSLDHFERELKAIGEFARRHQHRLTFHPGQFNQIGAWRPEVFTKTIRDLQAHAEILDRLNCDQNSVMVIHGGGTYGNKNETIERWVHQFHQLPNQVQNRIVIENCERGYNYRDMLNLSKQIGRPVVFDTHHHDCYSRSVEPLPDPSSFLPEIVDTWSRLGLRPKFHISEQAPNKRTGAHSDYVEIIPQYLLDLLDQGTDLDLMIEAKAKDKAVLHLTNKYSQYFRNGR